MRACKELQIFQRKIFARWKNENICHIFLHRLQILDFLEWNWNNE